MSRLLPLLAALSPFAHAESLDFRTDILPILTQAGCNAGACHGAATGQGGFRLSLLGYDPDEDHLRITRELRGRRIDVTVPAESLLLRKAAHQLDHEGGRRLPRASEGYGVLLRWIAQGAPRGSADLQVVSITVSPAEIRFSTPDTPVPLRVEAALSDGSRRDVTRLALYASNDDGIAEVSRQGEVSGRGRGLTSIMIRYGGQVAAARVALPYSERRPARLLDASQPLDRSISEGLARLGLEPSSEADDLTFLRRVTLDLAGRLPTAEEARRAHRDPPDPRRRLAWIDALLASSDFVDTWTLHLAEILRVGAKGSPEAAIQGYHGWIREQLTRRVPLDRMVRDLLTAQGDTRTVGPANFPALANDPRDLAEDVGRMFLGTRIACARCHAHPTDRWTQDDYHAFAAYFARVGREGDRVVVRLRGEVDHPKTGRAVEPKPLGAPRPVLDAGSISASDDARRVELAAWLTSPENPRFSRAWVNRVWKLCFGRGLVEPVDDLRPTNPASHPELLDDLAREFAETGFDLRRLLRTLVASRTYQLSGAATGLAATEDRLYSRFYPRELPAQVFLDAVAQATGVPPRFEGVPEATRAVQLANPRTPSTSLDVLGRCARERPCEGPGRTGGGLARTLHLIHGSLVHERLSGGIVDQLVAPPRPAPEIVDELYFRTLARPARPDELEQAVDWLRGATDLREAVEDLLWALINSREFGFNH